MTRPLSPAETKHNSRPKTRWARRTSPPRQSSSPCLRGSRQASYLNLRLLNNMASFFFYNVTFCLIQPLQFPLYSVVAIEQERWGADEMIRIVFESWSCFSIGRFCLQPASWRTSYFMHVLKLRCSHQQWQSSLLSVWRNSFLFLVLSACYFSLGPTTLSPTWHIVYIFANTRWLIELY